MYLQSSKGGKPSVLVIFTIKINEKKINEQEEESRWKINAFLKS